MAPQLYVLYEHASGYALFYVDEVEEVGALLPTVERAITDLSLFMSAVKLIAFSPFKSGTNALDNINAISEGILHEDLKLFLETNVPTGKKAKKEGGVELGVSDTRITATIQEQLGIKCAAGDAVSEVLRGLRLHFSNMVKGLTPLGEAKAQLGLGHSYSRAKVKFNVHRADNMIIQSIALLDQLDKDINTFSMRVREWYSYHFPEMIKIVNENYQYCRMAKLIGNRKSILNASEEMKEKIEEITMDSAKAAAVISASKMSMGMDISPIDLINIESFATRVISLSDYRKSLVSYLHKRMTSVAPSLSALIGDMVGARLISHAGSLTNLAKYPASTVQILGAEKALFRALKTKGNTPKYGLIFHSTFIGRAAAKNKGRISRYLANKCSMASRIDCFTETPSTIYGEKLRDQVEERLKFFDTGEAPRKNIDVMKEAVTEAALQGNVSEKSDGVSETTEKKKKKKKKRKSTVEEVDISQVVSDEDDNKAAEKGDGVSKTKEKKKKKRKSTVEVDISQVVSDEDDNVCTTPAKRAKVEESQDVQSSKKKKKKKHQADVDTSQVNGSSQEEEMSVDDSALSAGDSVKKKKKRKKLNGSAQEEEASVNDSIVSAGSPKKANKKKKIDKAQVEESADNVPQSLEDSAKKSKKKKKKVNISLAEETQDKSIYVDGSPKKTAKVNGSSQDESTADKKSVKKAKKKQKMLVESSQDSTANDSVCEQKTEKLKKKKKKGIAAE